MTSLQDVTARFDLVGSEYQVTSLANYESLAENLNRLPSGMTSLQDVIARFDLVGRSTKLHLLQITSP